MCTSCMKHKPPVIDIDKGTKDDPISLDDSDSDDKDDSMPTEEVFKIDSILHGHKSNLSQSK